MKASAALPEIWQWQNLEIKIRRRRGARRLTMTVHEDMSIRLSCGLRTRPQELSQFLESNRDWLERSVEKMQERRQTLPQWSYLPGEQFLLWGEPFTLKVIVGARAKIDIDQNFIVATILREWVSVGAPKSLYRQGLRKLLYELYRRQAKQVLPERMGLWSQITGLKPREVKIRGQKTLWGACHAHGLITLNLRLAVFPIPIADYVIVHELCHLIEANHSKAFWSLVGIHYPHFKEARKWMREHRNDADFLILR